MHPKQVSALFLTVCLILLPLSAKADLAIILTKEVNLPYALSPSNYDNSSSNYDNSISNYDNSESNYDNSPSNYDNSPSNYENGSTGKKRLLYNKNGILTYVGYYAITEDGLINFYSPKGLRLFYSPPKTDAIFDGNKGKFCGAIASKDGENVLALTKKGVITFARAEILLFELP